MKYWKQRYVGVDFDHCKPRLSSAAPRLCQTRSKHTATYVTGQSFPPRTHIRLVLLIYNNDDSLKFRCAAWTSLIYLLACLMLRVTLKRSYRCAHVDTGTQAPICDTSQWTNTDEGLHARQIKPCIVRQAVLRRAVLSARESDGRI